MARAAGIAMVWAVLLAMWGLATALAARGRARLTKVDIRKPIVRSLLVSAAFGFPLAWAVYWYCARFNPSPAASPVEVGGVFAVALFPAYATVVTVVALELAVQGRLKQGVHSRGAATRLASGAVLAVITMGALLVLGTACLFAAGPRVLG